MFNRFYITYEITYNMDSLASYPDRLLGAEGRIFVAQKGPDEKESLHLNMGAAYRTRHAVTEQIYFLNESQKDQDKTRVRKGLKGLFGSAINKATDISTEKGLVQFIKFVEKGLTQTIFLGIEDLQAQDSTTIFETHEESLAILFFTRTLNRCTSIT